MSRAERADAEFVLTADEREQLLRWSHGGGSARQAVRARIVLACAEPGVIYECFSGRPPAFSGGNSGSVRAHCSSLVSSTSTVSTRRVGEPNESAG